MAHSWVLCGSDGHPPLTAQPVDYLGGILTWGFLASSAPHSPQPPFESAKATRKHVIGPLTWRSAVNRRGVSIIRVIPFTRGCSHVQGTHVSDHLIVLWVVWLLHLPRVGARIWVVIISRSIAGWVSTTVTIVRVGPVVIRWSCV